MDKNVLRFLIQNNYKITFFHFVRARIMWLEERKNNLKKFIKKKYFQILVVKTILF